MKKTTFALFIAMLTYPLVSQGEALEKDAGIESLGSFGMSVGTSSSENYGRLQGMTVFILPRDNIGFYASYRDNGNKKSEPYYGNYDLVDSNDTLVYRKQEISMFSMGMTKSLTAYLGVYLGVGVAEKKGYAKMKYNNVPYPWTSAPNLNQYYYVNDRANTSSEKYLDAGIYLTYKYLLLKVGRNTITHSNEYELGFMIEL